MQYGAARLALAAQPEPKMDIGGIFFCWSAERQERRERRREPFCAESLWRVARPSARRVTTGKWPMKRLLYHCDCSAAGWGSLLQASCR